MKRDPALSFPALSFLWGAILLGAAVLSAGPGEAQSPAMERDELVIETATDAHRFTIELARTAEQRALGLMFRDQLPSDTGMLFIYDRERPVGMWMKNTLIPLDMLFIGSDGRIFQIVERTVPHSTEVIEAERPARAVLELNGGTAHRLGIEPGDRVRHEVFTTE